MLTSVKASESDMVIAVVGLACRICSGLEAVIPDVPDWKKVTNECEARSQNSRPKERRNGEAQAAMHSVLDVFQGGSSQRRRRSYRFRV